MSIKMCFWVEVYMLFVLHNYYDINIIFFIFVSLKRKVFAIPQLSPIKCLQKDMWDLLRLMQILTWLYVSD